MFGLYYPLEIGDPSFSASREDFVNALSDVPPEPARMDRILTVNQRRAEALR